MRLLKYGDNMKTHFQTASPAGLHSVAQKKGRYSCVKNEKKESLREVQP